MSDEYQDRPAGATSIATLMSYGIYEHGRQYTLQEVKRMLKEVKDAGYEPDESRVDREFVAKLEATEYLEENQKDIEPRLLKSLEEYDNTPVERRIGNMREERELERDILQNYAMAVEALRSYEWRLALNNQTPSGEVKILVGRSEACLKQAVNDFRGRWNKYYQKSMPDVEEFIQDQAQLQHLSDRRDSNKETLESSRREQYERDNPTVSKGSGCLVLLLPFILLAVISPFIGCGMSTKDVAGVYETAEIKESIKGSGSMYYSTTWVLDLAESGTFTLNENRLRKHMESKKYAPVPASSKEISGEWGLSDDGIICFWIKFVPKEAVPEKQWTEYGITRNEFHYSLSLDLQTNGDLVSGSVEGGITMSGGIRFDSIADKIAKTRFKRIE